MYIKKILKELWALIQKTNVYVKPAKGIKPESTAVRQLGALPLAFPGLIPINRKLLISYQKN